MKIITEYQTEGKQAFKLENAKLWKIFKCSNVSEQNFVIIIWHYAIIYLHQNRSWWYLKIYLEENVPKHVIDVGINLEFHESKLDKNTSIW